MNNIAGLIKSPHGLCTLREKGSAGCVECMTMIANASVIDGDYLAKVLHGQLKACDS